jgi:hypothetical protein
MQRSILEEKWRQQAELYKREAARLPHGKERDEALRMARLLKTASHMDDRLSSLGLSPPR